MPSAPINESGLLSIAEHSEQLLVLVSDGCGFSTLDVIGDGGGGDVELCPSMVI